MKNEKHRFKNAKIIALIIILILTLLLIIFAFNKSNLISISDIRKLFAENEPTINVAYHVYDNSNANNIKAIFTFDDPTGIKEIRGNDENETEKTINCSNKTSVTIDVVFQPNKEYQYTVVSNSGEKQFQLKITDDDINSLASVTYQTNTTYNTISAKIDYYNNYFNISKRYYRFENNSTWYEYSGNPVIVFYNELNKNNYGTPKKIYTKTVDTAGNQVFTTQGEYYLQNASIDVFSLVQSNSNNMNNTGFSNTARSNAQDYWFQPYALGLGHHAGASGYSGSFKLDCSRFNNLNIGIIYIYLYVFNNGGNQWVRETTTIYYTDGTSTSKVATTTGAITFNPDNNKTIDYIKLDFAGYDDDYFSSYGQIQRIDFYGITLRE